MLEVLVLGTAAGGGFPQWNCACENCQLARSGSLPARMQSSLAVSGNGTDWHLVNASPDVARQMERFIWPRLPESNERRRAPIRRVFLTNADLDHTLGLFQLREGFGVNVTAPAAVRASLEHGLAMTLVLDSYGGATWHDTSEDWQAVDDSGLEVRAVPLKSDAPRYDKNPAAGTHAVGYLFRDVNTTIGVFPDVAEISEEVRTALESCARVWFDGTFWSENEMITLSGRSASSMGHIPIGGDSGSLATLGALDRKRAAYLHINNTNPILRPDSAERLAVERAGVTIAEDGDHFRA